ncbi:hypothetical protein PPROV_000310100 [Pycnococcus provasolii]|uniref:NADH dehydrogenase [ubiquinone] 1 beta subcomplex subunit 7 n=1 Tax=Pycnococcus provasolii TaxID=41880 RepID=A0A830HH03_9CHLO|nr:hypothetical protein PPROV_000310100 [Pycnococcus provasolii]|mmetsp:Transcript_8244/g.18858  ORF Transcript_8244/g.18858 Transcript_8244/m.18858 type:complete len:98 (-) Transcript_8244:62-355(-)
MASVGDHARRQAAKLPSLSLDPPPMQATQEQLQQHKIPLQYRDYCAHLLIPLNECRVKNFWWPGTCKHERHEFEVCQYREYLRRVKKMEVQRAQEQG